MFRESAEDPWRLILGIYDDLIYSVSSFMKHKSASFKFLLLFSAGGILGMFLLSRPILYLIEEFPMPTLYFFMGAVLGGVPLIFKKSELKKFSIRGLFYVVVGIVIVTAVAFIPIGGSDSSLDADLKGNAFSGSCRLYSGYSFSTSRNKCFISSFGNGAL